MTVERAKMYKTAQLASIFELPAGFSNGQFVAVKYLCIGAYGKNFQCTNAAGAVACFSEHDLTRFIL